LYVLITKNPAITTTTATPAMIRFLLLGIVTSLADTGQCAQRNQVVGFNVTVGALMQILRGDGRSKAAQGAAAAASCSDRRESHSLEVRQFGRRRWELVSSRGVV
jgi:hypothetical protein